MANLERELTDPSLGDERSQTDAEAATNQKFLAYTGFLSDPDVNPDGRVFAASPQFQEYVEKTTQNDNTPGPVFQRVLEIIKDGDTQIIEFVSGNLETFTLLDEVYFSRQETVRTLTGADQLVLISPDFEVMEIFFNLVCATEDRSTWRQFVMENFSAIYLSCLYRYGPPRQYERMQKLFDTVGDEDPSFLIRYFWFSGRINRAVREIFDEEILAGQTNKAKALVRLLEEIQSSQPSKEGLDFLVSEFAHNRIPEMDPLNISRLFSRGIIPTQRLLNHLKVQGDDGFEGLSSFQRATKNGRFDPQNLIQRDLEYPRYLELSGKDPSHATYEKFAELPFVSEEERWPALTYSERLEAEAAAFEAARLYWFIRQRVEAGRKVVVVGNARYGEYFVVEPLKPYLDKLGVRVHFFHVRSSGNNQVENIISQSFLNHLLEESPDVVIVDGTSQPFDTTGNPRFSRAMTYYSQWFEKLNREKRFKRPYKFSHWLSVPTKQVVLEQLTDYIPPSNEGPEVIFANPVIDPDHFHDFPDDLKPHEPGFFDDPEAHAQEKSEIVFTLHGVQRLFRNRTEEKVVELAQAQISSALPKMLERTNPSSI